MKNVSKLPDFLRDKILRDFYKVYVMFIYWCFNWNDTEMDGICKDSNSSAINSYLHMYLN